MHRLTSGWVNEFDQEFTFKCPDHQSITQVKSYHSNYQEDRRFDFMCTSYTNSSENCEWSEYVNEFDKLLVYQCPNGGVIDGVSSYHINLFEDRRFRFYCCQKPGMCVYNCKYTGWTNRYDRPATYSVPTGYVMRGWISIHDNYTEDRLFEYDICEISETCDGFPTTSSTSSSSTITTTTRHSEPVHATSFSSYNPTLPFSLNTEETTTKHAVIFLLILSLRSCFSDWTWVNDYDQRFRFECPRDYVNEMDMPLIFQCHDGGVISGIESFHDNHYEDRKYKFKCCHYRLTGYLILKYVPLTLIVNTPLKLPLHLPPPPPPPPPGRPPPLEPHMMCTFSPWCTEIVRTLFPS
ncbi:uncharacterized protein LOC133181295 [Saccostrea echinata]|uniref:uncharacterized protein LOC133181295 n=1 Tax=Saccostrea echinata TaxID=191078 RepID=UPI002A83A313|nr:uncharacterized protein LOC133181295 [Saccostrea echinata]